MIKEIELFVEYYKCLIPKRDMSNLPQEVLLSCFMGDDFILSEYYKNKLWSKNNWRSELFIHDYGLGEDALQNNTIYGTNMGTYNFLLEHMDILRQWMNKLTLNSSIKSKRQD